MIVLHTEMNHGLIVGLAIVRSLKIQMHSDMLMPVVRIQIQEFLSLQVANIILQSNSMPSLQHYRIELSTNFIESS